MIEIKSLGGGVLYTAESAADVKKALEEAVRSGANLHGAYLRDANLDGANLHGAYLGGADLDGAYLHGANLDGANLHGAYLDGANLDGANLHGAYLGDANLDGAYLRDANLDGADLDGAYLHGANLDGAYLHGANLHDANLDGANLHGANLHDANLDGANLHGANLHDANLDGAYLGGELWTQVASKLEEAIHAMNDGGRHWIKGSLTRVLGDGSNAYCSVGSIHACCADGAVRALALWLLGSVTAGGIEAFNDFEDTTWEDVQTVFAVAIKHAQRFAKA